jgi:hypothetical protein
MGRNTLAEYEKIRRDECDDDLTNLCHSLLNKV